MALNKIKQLNNTKSITLLTALISFMPVAHATMVTDKYVVTLTAGTGYVPGQQLTINATYDDTANLVHAFGDGPNGIAQFGAGDDVVDGTVTAASMGYTRASDALITIDGLKSYAPLSARNVFTQSSSWTYLDGTVNGIHYQADNLTFAFTYDSKTNQTVFILRDYFSNLNGTQNAYEAGATGLGLTTKISATPTAAVPEPETYAMLIAGLGLIGFVARRKKS